MLGWELPRAGHTMPRTTGGGDTALLEVWRPAEQMQTRVHCRADADSSALAMVNAR